MNIDADSTPLVLLCPAWKRWGTARMVKPGTIIFHSQADEAAPFVDSVELLRNSGLPESALIVWAMNTGWPMKSRWRRWWRWWKMAGRRVNSQAQKALK